jgi:hypothetical protein
MDDAYGFAMALTDFPRSYRVIAEALVESAGLEAGTCRVCRVDLEGSPAPLDCPHCGAVFADPSTWIPRELDHTDRAGALTRGLVDRYMLIDQLAVADVFMAIVGYLAQRTGRTPRQIHEDYFSQAPPDDWWHRKMGDGREG